MAGARTRRPRSGPSPRTQVGQARSPAWRRVHARPGAQRASDPRAAASTTGGPRPGSRPPGSEQEREVELAGPQPGAISSGSPSARVSLTSGWRRRKIATACGISVAPADGNEATRSLPARTPRTRRQVLLGRAHLREDRLSVLDERHPRCGRPHASPVADHEAAPVSASSRAIDCETADCV